MLTVEGFRKKYPGSSEEQVALYGAAVAAELARGPVEPEPDVPMPRITVAAPLARASNLFVGERSASAPPPAPEARDLTTDIRRIVLGRRLTPRERAAAERPDMTGDDLLALLAGVPNAREFEALEGGD